MPEIEIRNIAHNNNSKRDLKDEIMYYAGGIYDIYDMAEETKPDNSTEDHLLYDDEI